MAKSDIYNINPKTDKGPRNAFDLSHSCLFTAPCGELIPCYVEDVKRGDKLKLALMSVTRSRPVNTAAFMSFDQKIDFWFVPYRLLWSSYDQWRISQTIRRSSLDMVQVGDQDLLPHFSWSDLSSFVATNKNVCTPKDPSLPNLASALRLLDMLGYGLIPYDNITQLVSKYSVPAADLTAKITRYYTQISSVGTSLNYFRLAAFQCIYMSSYRNDEYETLDPSYYNMDSLFLSGRSYPGPVPGRFPNNSSPNNLVVDSDDPVVTFNKLFTPRYKNWRKDLFTSLKPYSGFAANAPSMNTAGAGGTSFNWGPTNHPVETGEDYLDDEKFNKNFTDVFQRLPVSTFTNAISGSYGTGSAYLYAHNIRLLMSQDKFSRLMIYADKNYSSQMRALFGVDVEEPNVPRYLGSFRSDVSISDVTATSAGSDGEAQDPSTTVLGQLAGKGYGNNSDKVFEESFGEDGIVMGIQYIMPRNNYDAYRLNRFNTKLSRWDYYYPEFDGLGMQPVFAFERNTCESLGDELSTPSFYTSVLGYGARYAEYKCRQSETHGCFAANQPDMNWTLSNNQFGIMDAGEFACYKILPNITDRIFSMEYDGSQATDPFMCYLQYAVTKVSNMEALGLPKF